MHSSFNFRSFQRRRSQAGTVIDGCLWTTHMSSKKRARDLSLRKRFAACSRKEVGEAFNFYSLICVLEAAWTLWKWKSLSRVWLFVRECLEAVVLPLSSISGHLISVLKNFPHVIKHQRDWISQCTPIYHSPIHLPQDNGHHTAVSILVSTWNPILRLCFLGPRRVPTLLSWATKKQGLRQFQCLHFMEGECVGRKGMEEGRSGKGVK